LIKIQFITHNGLNRTLPSFFAKSYSVIDCHTWIMAYSTRLDQLLPGNISAFQFRPVKLWAPWVPSPSSFLHLSLALLGCLSGFADQFHFLLASSAVITRPQMLTFQLFRWA